MSELNRCWCRWTPTVKAFLHRSMCLLKLFFRFQVLLIILQPSSGQWYLFSPLPPCLARLYRLESTRKLKAIYKRQTSTHQISLCLVRNHRLWTAHALFQAESHSSYTYDRLSGSRKGPQKVMLALDRRMIDLY